MQPTDPSLIRFRAVVEGALAALEARRQEVNDLNVFPVADGDTGDNMALTLRAVVDELGRLGDQGPIERIGRVQIVESVARAALLGARGNSGIILANLVRGAAEVFTDPQYAGVLVDPPLVAKALRRASDAADGAIPPDKRAEGTILTVAREMAGQVEQVVAGLNGSAPLRSEDGPAAQNAAIANTLGAALETGEQTLEAGKAMLDALREAGVVDSGAFGLLIILSGCLGVLLGQEPPPLARQSAAQVVGPQHESSTYRFCTNFAVSGSGLETESAAVRLWELGDSVLVVGDAATLKVHVHTDDPDAAMAIFDGRGIVSHVEKADMHAQVAEQARRLGGPVQRTRSGVLAVVSSDGMRDLFRGPSVVGLVVGRSLNPATYDLLTAIQTVPADEVVILTNASHVLGAAQRAAELSQVDVRIVESFSQQAGLAVLVAFDPAQSAEDNVEAMRDTLADVRTGWVAEAGKDDEAGRFTRGEAVGYVDGEVSCWGDPADTLRCVMASLGSDGTELLTVLSGEGAPLDAAQVESLVPDGVELDHHAPGQPAYWYLVAAE